MASNPIECFPRLSPAPWSALSSMPPAERALHFWVPSVDDVAVIAITQVVTDEVLTQRIAARCAVSAIRKKGVTEKDCPEASIRAVHNFWWPLIHACSQVASEMDPVVRDLFPWVEFYLPLGPCCDACTALAGKVYARDGRVMAWFYPPWHIDCNLRVKDVGRRRPHLPDEEITIPPKYFFNPYDFMIAWGLMPAVIKSSPR